MCNKCNQCGTEYIKTNKLHGQKCDLCYALNGSFVARYRTNYFNNPILSNSCQKIMDTYILIVDNYFDGKLNQSTIPTNAKKCLIRLGYYPELAEEIDKLNPNSSSPKADAVLLEYQKLFNTNNSKETL